ncbi:MAG: mandelate racemase/muconate lactonizing enzyme family protein [Solirubrobacterales bacterium]|nr:mandelate racemase/muconate lactonizing enzyme family protein [Solirubrobacterales bacterium]
MRLATVEVIPYALPFRQPYVTACGALSRREMVLLRLRSDEGLTGLGEAVPLALRGGADLAEVVAQLQALAAAAEGSASALAAGVRSLAPPARCAVLMALDDLHSRTRGSSWSNPAEPWVAGVNYVRPSRSARCNATLVAGAPHEVAAEAERWAADGFGTFKLKLGTGEDAAQVQAVREALGAEAKIRVDANQAWEVADAAQILSAIEPFDVELAEQPVAGLEQMAELAALTSIPLAADESIENRQDAERAVELGACAATGVKLSKVGGAGEASAISMLLPIYLSSALDGPVGIAAAVELASELDDPSAPRFAHGLATQRLFAATIAAVECEIRDGVIHMPPGPGLGVEIDEDALQAHRL